MSDLTERAIADLKAELEQQRTRAEAAEQELAELRIQIGQHPATKAWAESSIGAITSLQAKLAAIAKTVGAIREGDDVVAFVERLLEENVRRSKLIAHLDNDKRNAAYNSEAMASIDEALGDHFACIDGHNPYTEERVPMLVAAYEKALAKLAAIRAHLAGLDMAKETRFFDVMQKITYRATGHLLAAAREALEP